ncbi:MAG TPA: class I SAM-dependent methyltransferase [Mycobacteriales bacterium]|nr:class I SAM-dependent methyltransferase [Mycobacteriales bacterium]
MDDVPALRFRADLYKGTAEYYDRFRRPYPDALFADLRSRVPIGGRGRLLDVACGTGQITFVLAHDFVETIAIDAEAETVAFAMAKAADRGTRGVHWLVGTAETVAVEGPFELITVGTAFHRLDRQTVARRMRELVCDDGAVALLWSPVPSDGEEPWQEELKRLMIDWLERAPDTERMPSGWQESLAAATDREVLERAGFAYDGRFEFSRDDIWTVESLIGFMYSTSILSREALGPAAPAFEADLAQRMSGFTRDGTFVHRTTCSYELVRPSTRRPGASRR